MSDDQQDRMQDAAPDEDLDDVRMHVGKLIEHVTPLVALLVDRRAEDRDLRAEERAWIRQSSFWERCYLTALSLGSTPAASAEIANASLKQRDTLFEDDDEGEVVPLRVVDHEREAEAT